MENLKKYKIHVLIVNINNLNFTKDLISDILNQTYKDFNLTLIDQNSNESGTKEFFNSLKKYDTFNIVFNSDNIDLNKLWNNFYLNNNEEYLCFLNNDMRITRNFIEDTVTILERDPNVGAVIHATNHLSYKKVTKLNYIIPTKKVMQGWDFTMRKSCYNLIPEELKVFCGDDFLFQKMYDNNWKLALCTSSPVIHFKGQSYKDLKYKKSDDLNIFRNKYRKGIITFNYKDYSNVYPTYYKFD